MRLLFERLPVSVPLAIACAFGLMGALSGLPTQPDHEFHLFIASHYEHTFFSLFEPRWYGGFFISGHPPLLHLLTALLAKIPVLGLERAYAVVLVLTPMALCAAAWRAGQVLAPGLPAGARASVLVALNPIVYLLLIPFGQAPFLLSMAFGLLAAVAFIDPESGLLDLLVGAAFGVCALASHPLGLVLPMLGAFRGVLVLRSIRVAFCSMLMTLLAMLALWPFIATYVFREVRSLPRNPLSLESGTNFAVAAAACLFVLSLFVLLDRKSTRVARGFGALGLVLSGFAHSGVGPIYWDKLLFFASLFAVFALAFDLSRQLTVPVLALALLASSYALSLKKPGRARDQRAALVETIAFLSRDGQERFRYLTLGLGKEALEIGRRAKAASVDGGMPWLRAVPELDGLAYPSLDELPLADAAAENALRTVLRRSDELSLAYVISADGRGGQIATELGYATIAAFPGNVVLYQKEAPPRVANVAPRVPRFAIGLSVAQWSVLWSALPLALLLFALVGSLRTNKRQTQVVDIE